MDTKSAGGCAARSARATSRSSCSPRSPRPSSEDDPHLREVLRIQLESHAFDVIEACDGQEAISRATEMLPDLALLDVMMPHVDGYEVCRRLRSAFGTRHIPIIMLTAKSTPELGG